MTEIIMKTGFLFFLQFIQPDFVPMHFLSVAVRILFGFNTKAKTVCSSDGHKRGKTSCVLNVAELVFISCHFLHIKHVIC